MVIFENASLEEKLTMLADAAKYDVACTSSGVERKGKAGHIGNSCASGICHSFSADGRCISLLKVLFTNECIYDCKYCVNRHSNDVPRTAFEPDELCKLVIEFYRRNYIEGLFLSSGVMVSPNYTMEKIFITIKLLREKYMFNGYIHCKAVPGAAPELIEAVGWYADRMSVNLELPTAESLKQLAPSKSRATILGPLRQIQNGIAESQQALGFMGGNKGAYWHTQRKLKERALLDGEASTRALSTSENLVSSRPSYLSLVNSDSNLSVENSNSALSVVNEKPVEYNASSYQNYRLTGISKHGKDRGFVAAGQSTQMIIGATPENDYELIAVTEKLYEAFDLKRVFFSAFVNVNHDSNLPTVNGSSLLLREHRLYQADWLLRYYGFRASEILTRDQPNFNIYLDPKCNWALRHMEFFPVEISTADYYRLMRVPGIGAKSAGRIVKARRAGRIDYSDLKRMGVVLKRALYFITCYGKPFYNLNMNEDFITRQLMGIEQPALMKAVGDDVTYRQLSLFDDPRFAQNGGIA